MSLEELQWLILVHTIWVMVVTELCFLDRRNGWVLFLPMVVLWRSTTLSFLSLGYVWLADMVTYCWSCRWICKMTSQAVCCCTSFSQNLVLEPTSDEIWALWHQSLSLKSDGFVNEDHLIRLCRNNQKNKEKDRFFEKLSLTNCFFKVFFYKKRKHCKNKTSTRKILRN